jgi:lysyl-tRNA synthetase class 2
MSLEEIRSARVNKLTKLEELEKDTFPIKTSRDFTVGEALKSFPKLSRRKKDIHLAGRVFSIRAHGGVIFCDFKDGSLVEEGKETKLASLQAYLRKDILTADEFNLFKETVDIGDFLEFKGSLFLTKKREKSIKVSAWRMLSKGLRPLPEKWHGLSDVEERFRKRYLDLLMNEGVNLRFVLRSRVISETRNYFAKHGFLEVETPILQPLPGGALAEPFKTHHNALDSDLYLRIAPELYLKRLLVGGYEKIYELGRNFRNEGIDSTHNPEFSMLEFYQAYKDADSIRPFVENLIKTLIKKAIRKRILQFNDQKISFAKKFTVISFYEVLKRYALVSDPINATREELNLKAKQFGIEVSGSDSKEKIMDNIFKKMCKPKLIQPTFVVDYPVLISPLAKRKDDDRELTDRFQLIIAGLELANGFSELNNPIDQKERFEKQSELRKSGDKEAAELDEAYIEAMEYGMPPAVGVGIGIERLLMLLLDIQNIKEVLLFPTLKPK